MTKAQRQQVYAKYVGHCAYCGKTIFLSRGNAEEVLSKNQKISESKNELDKQEKQYSADYEFIKKEIPKWPDWKVSSYNANFATSVHSKKATKE